MAGETFSHYVSKIWPKHSQFGDDIEFLGNFIIENNSLNGLELGGLYIPDEILLNIFSFLDIEEILKCSLVCKNWHNIAKSNALWQTIYNIREYPKKAKNLPWYVFYSYFSTDNFRNLVKNGNGQQKFEYWKTVANGGQGFIIEETPVGSDPLPAGMPEFNGHTSCFVTSYVNCLKYQKIDLRPERLLRYIIRKYKPTIYASEWYAGRFDCGCIYKLTLVCETKKLKWEYPDLEELLFRGVITPEHFKLVVAQVEQWEGKAWNKVEIFYDDYPEDIETISFIHEGKDKQFWAGHYGSKMAGGVLKFLFDSIEPTPQETEDIANSN